MLQLANASENDLYYGHPGGLWAQREPTEGAPSVVVLLPSKDGREWVEGVCKMGEEVVGVTCAQGEGFIVEQIHAIMALILFEPQGQDSKMRRIAKRARLTRQNLSTMSADTATDLQAKIEAARADVAERRGTPLLTALAEYTRRGVASFHTLPIVSAAPHALQALIGMEQMCETSSTGGGLDSLFNPRGCIKAAQDLAAKAFGAHAARFHADGGSASNRIVMSALLSPQDIALVDRSCHKSVHQSLVQIGCQAYFLGTYDIPEHKLHGIVPLSEITRALLDLKAQGILWRVKLLVLTNCTFDGLCYHPMRVMEACLRVHPGLTFLWDEAWFASAPFSEILSTRTAMVGARALREKFNEEGVDAEIRVWANTSAHKSLSAMRQGSFILRFDESFTASQEKRFNDMFEAFTTTSPHMAILASLDAARWQADHHGMQLHNGACARAQTLRTSIGEDPVLSQMYAVLGPEQLIPEGMRERAKADRTCLEMCMEDECVLDPTRVTIAWKAAMASSHVKKRLQDKGVQINRVSFNCCLLTCTIGVREADVLGALDALREIGREALPALPDPTASMLSAGSVIQRSWDSGVRLEKLGPFHYKFQGDTPDLVCMSPARLGRGLVPAMWLGRRVKMDELKAGIKAGRTFISRAFVIPYPPGCPILVPGQLVSRHTLHVIRLLVEEKVEIHGLAEQGLEVWTPSLVLPRPEDVCGRHFVLPLLSASVMGGVRLFLSSGDAGHGPAHDDGHIWLELWITYLICTLACLLMVARREARLFWAVLGSPREQVRLAVFGVLGVSATFVFVKSTRVCGPVLSLVLAQSKLLIDPVVDVICTRTWIEGAQAVALPLVIMGILIFTHDLDFQETGNGLPTHEKLAWGLAYPLLASACWGFGRSFKSPGTAGHWTTSTFFFLYHTLVALVTWLATGVQHAGEGFSNFPELLLTGLLLSLYEVSLMASSMLASPVATTVANSSMISVLYAIESAVGSAEPAYVKLLGCGICIIASLSFHQGRRVAPTLPPEEPDETPASGVAPLLEAVPPMKC